MKIKDITNWSERWSTAIGTMEVHPTIADGVLVDLSLWGTSIIGLAVQCSLLVQNTKPDWHETGRAHRNSITGVA